MSYVYDMIYIHTYTVYTYTHLLPFTDMSNKKATDWFWSHCPIQTVTLSVTVIHWSPSF